MGTEPAAGPAGTGPSNMRLCESSLVHSYAYDADSKTLWVRMHHERRLYRYDGIPIGIYTAMTEAPSLGGYFTRNVIKQYKGVRIEEKE